MKKYLKKSCFLRFIKCPTSAYFGWQGYTSKNGDDEFLAFLSEEGQAVGRAAHRLFAEGQHVGYKQPELACAQTRDLLQCENAVLFEGCLIAGQFLARPDVLIRKGDQLYLVEVKSKLGNLADHRASKMLFNCYGDIRAAWKDYVHDLAFQCQVAKRAFPNLEIIPWLLLPEQQSPATKDEISSQDEPSTTDQIAIQERREQSVLKFFNASKAVTHVSASVAQTMDKMRQVRESEERPVSPLRYQCRNCEFRLGNGRNKSDGFHECWGALAEPDPHIFDLNQLYALKQQDNKQKLLADQKIQDGTTSLYSISASELHGEHSNRQAIQLRNQLQGQEWIASELAEEIDNLQWPICFLDFETTMAAVPKHKGIRPYETLPFQFSAHVLHENGQYEHREWLNTIDRISTWPFVRALMKELDATGSVLVYTDYENRILKESLEFLSRFGNESRIERSWIFDLLNSGRILDQHEWVHRYYWAPLMGGKTSIKKVLPAVWTNNKTLHNHTAFREYFERVDGRILNPYETLPSIVLNGKEVSVREGCGAMQVYREMIHGEGAKCAESKKALAGLLREYCKLDTASQWIIFEHWKEQLGLAPAKSQMLDTSISNDPKSAFH